MNKYSDFDIVQKCLRLIEKELNWGSSDDWHNEVFIELSEVIQNKTQVLLSPTTLKRVWGKVNYSSAPSISTLNTLAQFAGYINWREFKLKTGRSDRKNITKNKSISQHRIIITSAALLAVIFISLFSMIGLNKTEGLIDLSKIKFTSQPVTEGVPNSVVFDFDLNGITSDSIYIQQFWDKTKTIKIHPNQTQATGIYYFPGYFRAKLLVEGEMIKEHDLFIKAPKWIATIDYDPVPKFLNNSDIQHEELSLPFENWNEIAKSESPLVSTYHLVDEFSDISADNFKLETSVMNSYNDKWAVCQTTRIVILGTTGAMVIPFSIPGCVSDLGLMLNNNYYSGKQNDLSAFGIDLSTETKIGIKVQDQKINVLVNGISIYKSHYNSPVGRLVGIRYRFLGVGQVNSLTVTSQSSEKSINLMNW